MAQEVGIRWVSCETYDFETFPTTPEHCIYLQGGGGYNSWCSGRAFSNLEQAVKRDVCLVLQGPVSVDGDTEWLNGRFESVLSEINCGQVCFFARESHTFELLRGLALSERGVSLGLDHDTAFFLSKNDLLKMAGLISMPTGRYNLIVLREDNEKPLVEKIPESAGLPSLERVVTIDPAYEAHSFRHWVRIHLYAKSVQTNRLHSSIIAVLAGKTTVLGPGSYHKNQSVWQYSLKGLGVVWKESITALPQSKLLGVLLSWFDSENSKVRRFLLAMKGVPLN